MRKLVRETIEKLGGWTSVAALCGVRENTVRLWAQNGCLNGVAVESALRFAEASEIPLRDFIAGYEVVQ